MSLSDFSDSENDLTEKDFNQGLKEVQAKVQMPKPPKSMVDAEWGFYED